MGDDGGDRTTIEDLNKLFEAMSILTFEQNSECWVIVTHIDDPHDFFIRPIAYTKHLTLVEQTGDRLPSSEVKVGLKVMYKSKRLLHYVRGEIKSVDNGNGKIVCTLFAFDYGINENSISIRRLRKINLATPVPPLATRCQLADCYPLQESFTKDAIDALKDYVCQEPVQMVIRENCTATKLNVELKSLDDVATLLAMTGFTNLGYDRNMVSRFNVPLPAVKESLKPRNLKVGDVLNVRTLSGNSLEGFYVAKIPEYEFYLEQRFPLNMATRQREQLSVTDLKPKKVVGVYQFSSNSYERGIIQEVIVPGETAVVKLVDIGITVEVSILLLRPINDNFMRYPAAALYCAVSQDQVGDKLLERFLNRGVTFMITVKEIGDEIRSPNIVTISQIS